jgi:hypothetical protein
MNIAWYLARLRRMGPWELATRIRDASVKRRWRREMGRPADNLAGIPLFEPPPEVKRFHLDSKAKGSLLKAADDLLAGRLQIFGREVALPRESADWFRDPDTGILAPSDVYSFDIEARDPGIIGNHKFLFEPSRLQHVQLLAAAYFTSGRDDYAALAAQQLQSWWRANPFLVGVHWTSGIEVGLRLVSFAWARRLLVGWPGSRDCFEGSALARDQIYRHQQYLSELRSHGSSANNHLLAEMLGLYVGGSAFPWFAESPAWSSAAAQALEAEARRQVFPDGVSREQASDYHAFVLEIFLAAAIESRIVGKLFGPSFYMVLAGMADAWAALLDTSLRAPRQGDSDEGRVLLFDAADQARQAVSLLAAARALVGAADWWPATGSDFRSQFFAAIGSPPAASSAAPRPTKRPSLFESAGQAILRDTENHGDELWCRCDHGPHGFLAIAAHAHADALSIELRHGGVDILADPGTYCYLTEPEFRRYFRSTIGHNTLEIGGTDQARFAGPFLWLDAPQSSLLYASGLEGGRLAQWRARHHGYARQPGNPVHERLVELDRVARRLRIVDQIKGSGSFPVRLAFHLGPTVAARLEDNSALLEWAGSGRRWRGRLALPRSLAWRTFSGCVQPWLGWYSPRFGERCATISLVGQGLLRGGEILETNLQIGAANEGAMSGAFTLARVETAVE